MAEILSPSPYAYLDGLSPAERQAAIRLRQHVSRDEWIAAARRARDYQARISELEAALNDLDDLTFDHTDAGPVGEGWLSDGAEEIRERVKKLLRNR